MGCDIHAMIEKKFRCNEAHTGYWINAGDPRIDRDYTLFSVLANVRNGDNIPFISDPRGVAENACSEFQAWHSFWDANAHSASWVTLAEMKAFDVSQKYYCTRLIISKDENGRIIRTCAGTSAKHFGEVGEVSVFGEFLNGESAWNELISKLEKAKEDWHTDDDVRLVFFFDN